MEPGQSQEPCTPQAPEDQSYAEAPAICPPDLCLQTRDERRREREAMLSPLLVLASCLLWL